MNEENRLPAEFLTQEVRALTNEVASSCKQYISLYEKMADDRQTAIKQCEVLNEIIKSLKAESKLATEFKACVRHGISEEIKKEVGVATAQVQEMIQEQVISGTERAIQRLHESVLKFSCNVSR